MLPRLSFQRFEKGGIFQMLTVAPRIPVRVNGKLYVLAFDLAAIASLKEDFGLTLEDLARLKATPAEQLSNPKLLIQFIYACTRSNDDPPTLKEIERMDFESILSFSDSISRAFDAANNFGLKKNSSGSPGKPEDGGQSSTGKSRSSSRSTDASSHQRKRSD
jgi:hypothetical protein